MPNTQNELLQSIHQIEILVAESAHRLAAHDDSLPRYQKYIGFIDEFGELIHWFKLIHEGIESFFQIHLEGEEIHRHLPNGTIDQNSEWGKKFVLLQERRNVNTRSLTIFIKAVYEWIYHVDQIDISSLVSAESRFKISFYNKVRHNLITHKKFEARKIQPLYFSVTDRSVQLGVQPLLLQSVIDSLQQIISNCSYLTLPSFVEDDLLDWQDFLIANHNSLRPAEKNLLEEHMKKFGLPFARPHQMAAFVLQIANEILSTIPPSPASSAPRR